MGFLSNYFTHDELAEVEKGKNILVIKKFMWCLPLRYGTIIGSLCIFAWSAFRLWHNNEQRRVGFGNLVDGIQWRFIEVSEAERVAGVLLDIYEIYHVMFLASMVSAPIQFIGGFWNLPWVLAVPLTWNFLYIATQFAIAVMLLKTYFDVIGVLLVILSTFMYGYIEMVMIHHVIEGWLGEYIKRKIKWRREQEEMEAM